MSQAPQLLPLTPGRLGDFRRLHAQGEGGGWCQCAAWWAPTWEGWSERSAEHNRDLREQVCAQRGGDGFLFYQGSEPLAWCQTAPRDWFAKLVAQFKRPADPACWMIGCFFIHPQRRRQGLARALLAAVLEELPSYGAARVEAYPRRQAACASDLWNGPQELFRQAGFEVLGGDADRWLLGRSLRLEA